MDRFELEGYVVDELIGFGGTGEVWRAREVATGEQVALKRLRARGAAATERLRREAGLLATLAGPHVVGVRRMLVEDDEAVMVMDYAAGGNLATVLGVRGALPPPEVVTIVAPIAAALAAAHSRDLVHGDITPANILFSAEGRPLLADFGVARAMRSTPDLVEGTVDFLDPAVAAGSPATPASDVFALGAVAFTALAGHSLWGSGTQDEVVTRAAQGHRPAVADAIPSAPEALADVIESMLRVDPDRRPDARSAGAAILRSGAAAPVGLVQTAAPLPPPPMTHVVRPAAPRRPPAGHAPSAKGADDGRDSETGWTPWRRRIVIAGAAGLGLAGAIGVGISLGNSAHGQARVLAPTAASVPPSVSPTVEPSTAPVSDHSTGPARRPTHSPSTARSGTPPVVAHSPGPPSRWTAIVAHLDALRAKAFADGDTAELAAVYAPGVAAYSSDVTTLQSLASRGLHAEGFAATVEHVSVESSTPSTERLRVIDQLTGYRLVDASGNVVGAGSARPARRFTMDLVNVGGSWRVAAINPAG